MSTENKQIRPANLATKIKPNIWISGWIPSCNKHFLKKYGITRILRCYEDGGENQFPDIKYLVIPADDLPEYNIAKHFDMAIEFINDAIANDETILIHCHAGISRSASIVIVYLMCLEAFKYLRYHRPIVCPNEGFTNQIVHWRYQHHGSDSCKKILGALNKIKNTT